MPAYPQPPYQSTLASSRCHAHGLRRAARGRMAVVLPNLLSQGGPATILKQNARLASSRKTIKKKNTIEASSCQHKWQKGSTLKRRPRQGTNWGVPQQTNQGPSEFSKCRWGSGRVGGGVDLQLLTRYSGFSMASPTHGSFSSSYASTWSFPAKRVAT